MSSFWRETVLALLISAATAIIFEFTRPMLGGATALRLGLLAAATAYLAVLLGTASGRSGRLLAAAAWMALAGALLLFNPSLGAWLILPAGFIWLLRSLFSYRRMLPALADAGLTGLALISAVVAAGHSHSLFLSLWCYFLVQALHGFLSKASAAPRHDRSIDPFDAAARQAEAALRRLSVRH